MKKLFLFLAVALFVGCTDFTDDINTINDRLDKLEQEAIPSIEEQISAIQESINALEKIDKSLDESIKALEKSDKATAEEIAALKEADKAIEAKIEELKKYVDEVLKSTKDWVSATFATLEQLNALSSEVAALKSLVDANQAEAAANLATAIASLETSLKKWVGEQLSNYYTIAEIDAKIAALEKAIADGDKALQAELNLLKSQLETAKAEITAAYKKAIEDAITKNNGVINDKIAKEIEAVNKLISELEDKLAKLQIQVDKNTQDIANLLARIQSVSYLPAYSDGVTTINHIGHLSEVTLDFKVSPKECAEELAKVWQTAVSCEALYTKTRAASLVKMPATAFEVTDAENGVITVTASGENLSQDFFAGLQEAMVALVISDGNNSITSDYIPMVAKEITDEIWYTSTDGNIVTPNSTTDFGANIISNTYKNGRGVIKFDAPVTAIGSYAFGVDDKSLGVNLQTIVIPNSVIEIRSRAFKYSKLTSITIPDNVKSLGFGAFAYCQELIKVHLGNGVESLGQHTFRACTKLTGVNIPEKITVIPDYCFYDCQSLPQIAIHDKIASIGTEAFHQCDNLKRVDITDFVAWCRIEMTGRTSSPFGKAHADLYVNGQHITDLVIPAGVTEIKPNVFYHSNFATITIPESVTSIGDGAFGRLTSTTAFYGKFATEDHRSLVIDNKLLGVAQAGLTSYRVPDGITSIGCAIFNYTKINSITIPSSVTKLDGNAMFYYLDYDSIVIFEGTTPPTIDSDSIFANIEGAIFVPAKAVDAYKNAWSKYAAYIKPYEEDLNVITYTSTDGNIVTPRSGEEVNDFRTIESLFGASLVSNTYENGVGRMVFDGPITLIGKAAFRSIDNLETITLPNGIKHLGRYAFHGNDYLKSIKLPDYLEVINQDAFHLCKAITELTLPDSVTKIGDEAFCNCNKLEYIYSKFSTPDNMALVINGTLNWVSRNYPAGDYKIPDGVTKIQNNAICYPNNVITVTIPESVETFNTHPFLGAYNISAYYGKYTVNNRHFIKDNILYGAAVNGLTEYEIPEGVTGTGYRLFRGCEFTKITLPASLEKIGNKFFEACDKLQVIYCKAVVPPTQGEDYNIFLYCSKIPTIYVPRASVEAYKTATGWSQYADKIVGYDF